MQTRDQGKTLDYITRTFVDEPDWLKAARTKGESLVPGMQLSAYEGHLLRWLVRISGAKRILEVGTFMGVSTLWMASGLPADGQIVTLEKSAESAKLARGHFDASPHAKQIEIIEGDALPWLQHNREPFDLIFIDAEKKSYAAYLDAALKFLSPHGWIVGDNTLLFGSMAGEESREVTAESKAAMTKFNATLADANRFESVLLPTPEGMTVARRKT